MSQPALSVDALSKSFGGLQVFKDLTFDLAPGEILGVIGPNGAGKTTLVNVLSNQLAATSGDVRLYGEVVSGRSFPATARLGLVRSFQHTSVFPTATVAENLVRARYFSGRPPYIHSEAAELLEVCGLRAVLHRKAVDLPYGLQKTLGLVMSCLSEPKVLMMDEPAAGLERAERIVVDKLVHYASSVLKCSIMIVEHDMDLIRRLCPRSIVLEGGRILAQGATPNVLSEPSVISAYLGEALETNDAVH